MRIIIEQTDDGFMHTAVCDRCGTPVDVTPPDFPNSHAPSFNCGCRGCTGSDGRDTPAWMKSTDQSGKSRVYLGGLMRFEG